MASSVGREHLDPAQQQRQQQQQQQQQTKLKLETEKHNGPATQMNIHDIVRNS